MQSMLSARTNWTKLHSLVFSRAAYLMRPSANFAFVMLLLMCLIALSLASITSPRYVTCISCVTGWPSYVSVNRSRLT